MTRIASACLALVSLVMLGCASQPIKNPDPRDPWERLNRRTYAFNDAIDRAVLKPVAKGYRKVTPRPVRTGVSNFMDNLQYPITIVNDVLQGKLKPAASDTGRLVLNTTVGIGGIFDVASKAGLQKGDEDFGQTLGKWGVRPGPFVMLPLLGPSTVRDTFGKIPDHYTNPRFYMSHSSGTLGHDWVTYGLDAVDIIDIRSRLLETTDPTLERVYDRYAFVRNAWLQRREYLVTDGKVSQPANEEPLEDPEAEKGDDKSTTPGPDNAPKNPPQK